MSYASWQPQSPAAPGPERRDWVVDLASHRIVRVDAVLAPAPHEARAVPSSQEWWDSPEPMILTHDRCAPPRLPGGDMRSSLRGQHQHQDQGGLESVSKTQQDPAPFDRAQIEARAYEIYCARGCTDGLDVVDWLEAERQLRLEAGIEDPAPREAEPARGGEPALD